MPHPLRVRSSRYVDPRPWQPLSDAEWDALAPHLARAEGAAGRPLAGGARARLDAVFRVVAGGLRWRQARHEGVSADAVSRQFRRWAHQGLFVRLLRQVAKGKRAAVPPALRAIEHWICAAHRRSVRAVGVYAIAVARRLGMLSALPGPPWLLPDPDLSEAVMRVVIQRITPGAGRTPKREWHALRQILRVARGRRRIPRSLVPA